MRRRGGVLRLLRISRTVPDLDQAAAFYREALDFRVIDAATPGAAWAS